MHGADVDRTDWYGNDLLLTLNLYKSLCFLQDLVTGVDSWSISELVHAIVIMAHYHALAGFALGCGVNPEIDTPLGHTGMGKDGEVQLIKIPFCSNPALGVGSSTPAQSDSESEPLSPVARSPTHPAVSESLVQHYIESEWILFF